MIETRIQYYAAAFTRPGQIGQLRVTCEGGRQVSQEWTGVTYRNEREAMRDLERLNCGGAK